MEIVLKLSNTVVHISHLKIAAPISIPIINFRSHCNPSQFPVFLFAVIN